MPRQVEPVLANVGGNYQRIGVSQWQEAVKDVMPRRLGHTLVFTSQPEQMTDFYTEVLGLRVSDRIAGGLVTFLNAEPGDHHVFGFIWSTHSGFQPCQLRGAFGGRHRARGGPDALRRASRRVGIGTPHHRIQLLPLQPRPVGELDRMVQRHRPGRFVLGRR